MGLGSCFSLLTEDIYHGVQVFDEVDLLAFVGIILFYESKMISHCETQCVTCNDVNILSFRSRSNLSSHVIRLHVCCLQSFD